VSCLEDQQDQVVWAVPEDRAASAAQWGREALVVSVASAVQEDRAVSAASVVSAVPWDRGVLEVSAVQEDRAVSAVQEDRGALAASVAPEGVRDGDCFSNSLLSEEPLGRHHGAPINWRSSSGG
jgi:hypothetical protein